MKKRDKLFTKNGEEIECNMVGLVEGISGRTIVVYTTADNEKEFLASYYNLDGNKFILEEITSEEEWDTLEKRFDRIIDEFRNNRKN